MKKFTTKLLMSIIAVAFAFVALGTSTYAWFSMNTQVSVSSMDIGAKSNVTYLLVSRSNMGDDAPANAAAIQAENEGAGYTSVTISTAAKEVYPVAPATALEFYTAADESENAEHKEGHTKTKTEYVAGTGVAAPTLWYTMQGTSPNEGGHTGIANTEQNVTATVFTDYVLKYTFYFTIAEGASAATNLVVSNATFTNATGAAAPTGLRCLVVGSAGSAILTPSTTSSATVLVSALDSATVSAVTVYIYLDGNDASVYTNNITNLTGKVALDFTVTAGN